MIYWVTIIILIFGSGLGQIFKKILDYEITQMTWMKDAEVFYRQLDLEIKTIVARQEIVTKSFDGQTLFNPDVSSDDSNLWLIPVTDFHDSLTHSVFRISMIPTVVVPRFQRNNLTKQLKNWVALVHPSQPQPKTCSNKLPVIFNPTIRPNLESQPLHNLDSKKVRYFSS